MQVGLERRSNRWRAYPEGGHEGVISKRRGRPSAMGLYAALATTDLARASPPFETDVIEIANAGGVRIIAVAEYGDIDQVRRRGILPDLGIDAREVDLLVKPAANPVVTGIGNEVRETADVFVFLRVQPIAQITPWRASRRDLSQTEETAAPGDPRLRACVRRGDCGLAIRPPREHRISDEVGPTRNEYRLNRIERSAVTPDSARTLATPRDHRSAPSRVWAQSMGFTRFRRPSGRSTASSAATARRPC
jgi:hypothetical protein